MTAHPRSISVAPGDQRQKGRGDPFTTGLLRSLALLRSTDESGTHPGAPATAGKRSHQKVELGLPSFRPYSQ